MIQILKMKSLLPAVVLAGFLSLAGTAQACDYYWKTVTVYVTVEEPVVKTVTLYDHCGKPYEVTVRTTRTVSVPVTKKVKVYI